MCKLLISGLILCLQFFASDSSLAQSLSTIHPDAITDDKWQVYIAEFRFNDHLAHEFIQVLVNADGQIRVPLEVIFVAGEANVVQQNLHLWEFSVPSLNTRLVMNIENYQMLQNKAVMTPTAGQVLWHYDELLIAPSLVDDLFGLSISFDRSEMLLAVSSTRPWPRDLRLAREMRWRRMGVIQEEGLPAFEQNTPYQLSGAPMATLNLVHASSKASASATTHNTTFALQAVSEAIYLTNNIAMRGTAEKGIESARLSSGRSAAQGDLLNINSLYQFEFGDVSAYTVPLLKSGSTGVGIRLRGVPFDRPDNFDITFVEGNAPYGWDAELYLEGQLHEFIKVGDDGRYRFEDIPLNFGNNSIVVKLYGPAGETRDIDYSQRVGSRLKPGETDWQVHVGRVGRSLFNFSDNKRVQPDAIIGSLRSSIGISKNISAGLSYARYAQLVSDDSTSSSDFFGLELTPIFGNIALNIQYSWQATGDFAYSLRTSLPLGFTSLSVAYEKFQEGFGRFDGQEEVSNALRQRLNLRSSIPLSIIGLGGERLTLSHELVQNHNGSRIIRQQLGYGHRIGSTAISHKFNRSIPYSHSGGQSIDIIDYQLLGRLRRGQWSFSTEVNYAIKPLASFRNARVNGLYRFNEKQYFSLSANYNEAGAKSYSVSYSHLFKRFSANFNAAHFADNVSVGIGIQFSFGHVPDYGMHMTSTINLDQGMALIKAHEQVNDRWQPLENLQVRVNNRPLDLDTGEDGQLLLENLNRFTATHIQVNQHSLPDPFLVPREPNRAIWVRPGQIINVPIKLLESTLVSGTVLIELKDGRRLPVSRKRLQFLNAQGRIMAETITLNDGFYEFSQAFTGNWAIRLAPDQAGWRDELHYRPFPLIITNDDDFEVRGNDLIFSANSDVTDDMLVNPPSPLKKIE